MKLRCLLIALAFLAAFASDSWGQSKQPSSKATQQKSNEQDRGTESSPVVVKVMPTEKPKDELEAEKTKQESDRQLVKLTGDLANYTQLLFGATAALVIAAAGLVILGFYQSRDTKRSIKAAEDSARIAARALTELERPFVGIEITSVGFSVKDPKSDPYVMLEGDLRFRFANYGRTPATIIELFDEFHVCEPGKMPDPVNPEIEGIKFPFGFIVGANRRSPPSTRSQSEGIDQNIWLTFTAGESELFLIGFIRFRDIFDNRHLTGFCLRFDKRDGRFFFNGDERYNYTYEEKKKRADPP
jgi:hypothetical protein